MWPRLNGRTRCPVRLRLCVCVFVWPIDALLARTLNRLMFLTLTHTHAERSEWLIRSRAARSLRVKCVPIICAGPVHRESMSEGRRSESVDAMGYSAPIRSTPMGHELSRRRTEKTPLHSSARARARSHLNVCTQLTIGQDRRAPAHPILLAV